MILLHFSLTHINSSLTFPDFPRFARQRPLCHALTEAFLARTRERCPLLDSSPSFEYVQALRFLTFTMICQTHLKFLTQLVSS